MSYEGKFAATDDADWEEAVALFDNDTGEPLGDAADATFELNVLDGGTALLVASSAAGTITKPEDHIIRWRFTVAQLGALCIGNTYKVGITMTIDGGRVVQLLVGSLVFTGGGLA